MFASLLIGESAAMVKLRALVERVAQRNIAVLIHGPTGSGKELVARALHAGSGRAGALVSLNVCAIPDAMFEAMLFGHVRGAFTGAIADAPGFLAEGNGGTVFLDEIGGLSEPLQMKLLRAVETREFRSVGAKRDRCSDFRVIAAASEGPQHLLAEGRLRSDLLHRISAFSIAVPPLKERLDDIPLLVRHFLLHHSDGPYTVKCRDTEVLQLLRDYDWPGNVRELRNIMDCWITLSDSRELELSLLNEVLSLAHFPVHSDLGTSSEHRRRQNNYSLSSRAIQREWQRALE